MKRIRMDQILSLTIDTELVGIDCRGEERSQVIRDILYRYERTGLARRYLRKDGNVGWRATDSLREDVREQEDEAIND